MAPFLTYTTSISQIFFFFFFFILLSPLFTLTTKAKFSEQVPEPNSDGNHHTDNKMTHLHFYFHDIVSGKHSTAIVVAGERNKFGMTTIFDDPLTEGTEHGSKAVGRAQGMYTASSLDMVALGMVMTFKFEVGIYNGSTLSVLGRNPYLETVREMPVVGGTGLFRFARGYALAKTVRFNIGTGDAVVEYNVFVMNH